MMTDNELEILKDVRNVLLRIQEAKSYHTVSELSDWARECLSKHWPPSNEDETV
jgi:hypothetical protein